MIDGGWYRRAMRKASPNCNDRPDPVDISLLVIHNISLPPGVYGGDYVIRFFQNQLCVGDHPYFTEIADLKVSAHCFIRRSGDVIQFVPFDRRAWHAGQSCFAGRQNCNDYAIGIELEGTDSAPYTEQQYLALSELTLALMRDYPQITVERIVGHSDIAPGRKTDPGPAFNWEHYRSQLTHKTIKRR